MFAAFDNFPALLIWVPLISGILCFFMRKEHLVKNWAIFSTLITLGLSGASLYFSGPKAFDLNHVSYYWLKSLGSSFSLGLDGMGKLLCFLTALSYPLILIVTYGNKYTKPGNFYGLMLLTQCGLLGVFMAMDALVFYFFWELALIPVYFLASQWGGEKRIQATFKFFIYTFAGSVLMLVGIIYVYLKTSGASFSLAAFYETGRLLSAKEQYAMFCLFFVAFAIKMPIFPFHTWQPDTYEQSPPAVTMVLSGIMVKMGVFGLIRWLIPLFPAALPKFDHIVIGLSVIGMIYASLIAMVQDDLRRLVAYSSIAHIGLMCAALFAANQTGMQGVMIQMFNHGINIIGLWIVVDLVEQRTGTRKISELGGLANQAPGLAIMLVIVALANIALPLTNAFIGEFLMFSGLFQFSAWYTAVAGLSIILSAVYMLNMIKNVFLGETKPAFAGLLELTRTEKIILSVIVVTIFMVGFYPQPLLDLTQEVTNTLLRRFTLR